ncbi:MAG: peptidoglycan editing factor PgeF [Rickettsiaceae bacterium]|nr:peptidoglycan editing factor PgeF [Rickettsiaceae bacterium]
MQYQLIQGKVECHIFDKSVSNCLYKQSINNDPLTNQLVQQNFEDVRVKLKLRHIFTMTQTHSANVVLVAQHNLSTQINADAAITKEKNLALSVITADCVPVLLASASGEVIGIMHCGWKGARDNIIKNTTMHMRKLQSSHKIPIFAFIGPSIKQKSYEVGIDFYQNFLDEKLTNQQFFINSNKENHYMFDLVGYVAYKLKQENIEIKKISEDDTYSMADKYPSFRRFTHTGEVYNSNILSIIHIKS